MSGSEQGMNITDVFELSVMKQVAIIQALDAFNTSYLCNYFNGLSDNTLCTTKHYYVVE